MSKPPKECEGRATFQHNVTGANPERVSDWLDEIEAQMDETSPYYLPRLIAEIRRLQAEQRGAQPSSAPFLEIAAGRAEGRRDDRRPAPPERPAPAASSGAAPQEWQPIETLDPECLDVILRPHRVWGAMDVCRMTEAQKGQLTGVLSRGIDWRWMNGDHTTAWTEDAFLPFWMPRPPVPAAPPKRPTPADTQE